MFWFATTNIAVAFLMLLIAILLMVYTASTTAGDWVLGIEGPLLIVYLTILLLRGRDSTKATKPTTPQTPATPQTPNSA